LWFVRFFFFVFGVDADGFEHVLSGDVAAGSDAHLAADAFVHVEEDGGVGFVFENWGVAFEVVLYWRGFGFGFVAFFGDDVVGVVADGEFSDGIQILFEVFRVLVVEFEVENGV
jgi:hypothetical protein